MQLILYQSGNDDDDDDDVDYDNDNDGDDAKSQCCFEIQRNERVIKIWPYGRNRVHFHD